MRLIGSLWPLVIQGFALYTTLLSVCIVAEAQPPTKILRIGFLGTPPRSAISERIEAFRQGLREHGYDDGKNIGIEWRMQMGD